MDRLAKAWVQGQGQGDQVDGRDKQVGIRLGRGLVVVRRAILGRGIEARPAGVGRANPAAETELEGELGFDWGTRASEGLGAGSDQ